MERPKLPEKVHQAQELLNVHAYLLNVQSVLESLKNDLAKLDFSLMLFGNTYQLAKFELDERQRDGRAEKLRALLLQYFEEEVEEAKKYFDKVEIISPPLP